MFISPHIPAQFKKGTLKLQQTDDGTRRVAEATLVIEPFPASLAHELGEDICGHLFDVDDRIREELESIDLRVRAGLMRVDVRHDEALDPIARIQPVSVKDVTVSRVEEKKSSRQWLSCSFVLVFSLEEKAARNFVLDEFGKTLVWSFEGLQGELLSRAALHESLANIGEPDGAGQTSVSFGVAGGEMHDIDPKKHRAAAASLRKSAKAH